MADPTGELADGALRLDFDRRLMLRSVAPDHIGCGTVAYRELDDALGRPPPRVRCWRMRAPAGTAGTPWPVCCGSRCSAALLDMRT